MNKKEIEDKLEIWLRQPEEDECLEFKEAVNTFDKEKIGKYFLSSFK